MAVIEYDGATVEAITWHTGGVMLHTNEGSRNVREDAKVECGLAITPVMDLHLIFGKRVTATEARFGNGY